MTQTHPFVASAGSHVPNAMFESRARIVVTVSDQGQGPTDPFVGLVPSPDSGSAGLGLWLKHQLCNQVALETGAHGYTLRLVQGNPYLCL